jgi:hypothetical protein
MLVVVSNTLSLISNSKEQFPLVAYFNIFKVDRTLSEASFAVTIQRASRFYCFGETH